MRRENALPDRVRACPGACLVGSPTRAALEPRLGDIRAPPWRSADLAALEDALRQTLATRVRLVGNERAGRIEIVYTSAEDLERLSELITGRRT